MIPRSGRSEAVPYSLSRWTDLPAAKWDWFKTAIRAGRMQAFDQQTGVPHWWSLLPDDVHSLVFWTKNPKNLVVDYDLIRPYRIKAHVTITGWTEVEHAAPSYTHASNWAGALAKLIGKENITWRFSPVPLLSSQEVMDRFRLIAGRMVGSTNAVFLSFLQPNDELPETRGTWDRRELTSELFRIAKDHDIELRLCNADEETPVLVKGICVPCENGAVPEKCGCAIMADPFTINETCVYGCEYCYAADKSLNPKKRNTTGKRRVPIVT